MFQGLTEAFFTKDHILQNLNDKEVLIKNYLYFWPDPKSINELKSIVQNYLEWRARYITLIEDYENRKKNEFFEIIVGDNETSKINCFKGSIYCYESAMIHFIWRFKLVLERDEKIVECNESYKILQSNYCH